MITVKPIGTVVTLWQQRSVAAMPQYRDGVSGAGQKWQSSVDTAQANWAAGVGQAVAANSYDHGVAGKAGKYVDKSVNVGAGRFGPGVQAATAAFTAGMGKVLGVISGITLPARMAKGSNDARAAAVSAALHQAKLAGQLK